MPIVSFWVTGQYNPQPGKNLGVLKIHIQQVQKKVAPTYIALEKSPPNGPDPIGEQAIEHPPSVIRRAIVGSAPVVHVRDMQESAN